MKSVRPATDDGNNVDHDVENESLGSRRVAAVGPEQVRPSYVTFREYFYRGPMLATSLCGPTSSRHDHAESVRNTRVPCNFVASVRHDKFLFTGSNSASLVLIFERIDQY